MLTVGCVNASRDRVNSVAAPGEIRTLRSSPPKRFLRFALLACGAKPTQANRTELYGSAKNGEERNKLPYLHAHVHFVYLMLYACVLIGSAPETMPSCSGFTSERTLLTLPNLETNCC